MKSMAGTLPAGLSVRAAILNQASDGFDSPEESALTGRLTYCGLPHGTLSVNRKREIDVKFRCY